MFKKIEIWILYLVLVLVFISYIIFGALVRRELLGGGFIPILTPISKVALFLAEIPSNIKNMNDVDIIKPNIAFENRFGKKSGFIGKTLDVSSYFLLSKYNGDLKEHIVELVDLTSFNIMHQWNPNINEILKEVDYGNEIWKNLKIDRTDFRSKIWHPLFENDGSIIFHIDHSPLIKINSNNDLVWILDDIPYHHSIEKDHENNIWVCGRYFPNKIDEKYVSNEIEDFLNDKEYYDDGIRKISSNGEILFDKSISEIFIENGMESLIFGRGMFFKDPIHLNDIQPVLENGEFWKQGDVFLSLRNQSMIMLYRPSNNKIIWYDRGPFSEQHDIDILDNNKISIFDNNAKRFFNGREVDSTNNVFVYDFENDNYNKFMYKGITDLDLRTKSEGRSEILPNGNLYVEESNYGRSVLFDNYNKPIWVHYNRYGDDLFKVCWSRIIYDSYEVELIKKFLESK